MCGLWPDGPAAVGVLSSQVWPDHRTAGRRNVNRHAASDGPRKVGGFGVVHKSGMGRCDDSAAHLVDSPDRSDNAAGRRQWSLLGFVAADESAGHLSSSAAIPLVRCPVSLEVNSAVSSLWNHRRFHLLCRLAMVMAGSSEECHDLSGANNGAANSLLLVLWSKICGQRSALAFPVHYNSDLVASLDIIRIDTAQCSRGD